MGGRVGVREVETERVCSAARLFSRANSPEELLLYYILIIMFIIRIIILIII